MTKSRVVRAVFSRKGKVALGVVALVVVGGMLCPEEAQATLVKQVTKTSNIINGPIKKLGLTAATLGGLTFSIVKGNVKLAGLVLLIAGITSLTLAWVGGDMSIGKVG